jgi:hypothetical protein
MGLSFTVADGRRQRIHSHVRVPRDSWPRFTVSNSRFHQPGGPGPRVYIPQEHGGPVILPGTGFPSAVRRVMVKVFDPASTPMSESESYVTTDGQSDSLSWNKAPIWGLRPGFVDVGLSLWREDASVIYNCCLPSPAQQFSFPSRVGNVTIFYCLRFETYLFVASYDSQGYGGSIRPRLHTGLAPHLCQYNYSYVNKVKAIKIAQPLRLRSGIFS